MSTNKSTNFLFFKFEKMSLGKNPMGNGWKWRYAKLYSWWLFLLTTYLRPPGIGMFLPHMLNGVGWGGGDDNVPCIGTHVQSATEWTASVHTSHMSQRNVTRVQSATEWTASVQTLHMSQRNVTRVQSATEWTASVQTLHMSQRNVTRVQSATEWTASVHTLHMPKPVM